MNTTERTSRGILGVASLFACLLMAVLIGRSSLTPINLSARGNDQPGQAGQGETPPLEEQTVPERLDIPEIENLWFIGRCTNDGNHTALYSGATPEHPGALALLKKLGVKTIISVDGARPDFEQAKAFGMTYVHIPIPYRGVETGVARELGQFVQQQAGGIYIHCHHGKHRGPAAAAICARALELLDSQESQAFMKQVGTDPNYSGLWRDVAAYVPPAENDQLAEYKHLQIGQAAPTESLVNSMVQIDHLFEIIANELDAVGSSTAECTSNSLLLAEEFTETTRQLETQGAHAEGAPSAEFLPLLQASASRAAELHQALKNGHAQQAKLLLGQLKQDCKSCHTKFRDQ